MKHKTIYNKTRKLITQREVAAGNLDTAEETLEKLLEKDPECDWALGLLAEIYYWRGECAPPGEKMELFRQGVEYGERGLAANEDSLEANFWLSVNYGMYGAEKGILKSLELINPMRACAERALAMDESYFYGGPWRVLGRLYHKAPGWPFSIGSTRKAVECLEKALEFGPDFYLNHLFLAEVFISTWDKAKARKHLEWILAAPPSKYHEQEDAGYKADAEALLKRL